MFFKSVFLSLWFQEWFLINNLYNYYFPENNPKPNAKKEPRQLYLQMYWKLFRLRASLILPEYRRKLPNTCLLFKVNDTIGAIIPIELEGLSESKIEEKLITYFRRYNNAFSINPHMKIYLQLDTPIQDQILIEHFQAEYPNIKILNPQEQIPYSRALHYDEIKIKTKTLVINQETLSFLVSFLYMGLVYRFLKYRLSKYRLLIDKEVAENFDQRMASEFTNQQEKNRWEQLKPILERVEPKDLVAVPKYMEENNCNFSRELWLIDNVMHHHWNVLFWKNGYRQTRHLSCLLSANIILNYIFITDKGLIQGSKGEKESYLAGNVFHKLWITLAFNWHSFWFALRKL